MNAEPSLVVFDGVCNLCNGAVQFIIKRDPVIAGRNPQFVFTAAQSPYGQAQLAAHGLEGLSLDSFVLIENRQAYLRTDAALRITIKLKGLWFLFVAFRFVPAVVRDFFYDALAACRYRLFGKRQQCWLPTVELQSRFIVDLD